MLILNKLYENYNFNLIITVGKLENNLEFVEYFKLSEYAEIDILQSSHIGNAIR